MAKRFTDTEKWKKVWFRNLRPKFKCFWQYVTDNCNHAGIWEVDFNLASYLIGTKLDEEEIRQEFKKQFVELEGGKRWFVKDFVEFQYGCLNPSNNAHKSVLSILEKSGVGEGLVCPSLGALDMDKDTDKDMDKDKYTSEDLELSTLLLERIRDNVPTFKQPDLAKWSDHVRLMRDRDERTPEQIRFLIEWCQKDSFWKANILSTKKLREKFDTLVAHAKRGSLLKVTGRGLA